MRRSVIVAVALVVLAAALWSARRLAPELLAFLSHVRALGPWAPLIFISVYALGVVVLVPGSWFTPLGGALFGLVRGVVYSLTGAVLGSTLAFLVGRHLARGAVERRLARMPRFQRIDRAVAGEAGRIVTLLRLSPVMPFNLLNYGLGVTAIRLRDFLIGSVGMVPSAIVYAYAGKVMGEAFALSGPAAVPRTASYYAIVVAGLVATVAATVVVTRTARRALTEV